MSRLRVAALAALSFVAGLAVQAWGPAVAAQGTLTTLKRVDLGDWCPGKEVTIGIEEIGPQRQSRHYHNAYSFAWMIEGSQTRTVDGKPVETFKTGEVVEEAPKEVSESEILTPTKVLLLRIAAKDEPLTVRLP